MVQFGSDVPVSEPQASPVALGRRAKFGGLVCWAGLFALCLAGPAAAADVAAPAAAVATPAPASAAAPETEEIFAVVNGTVITLKYFNTAYHMAARDKFYHGQAPDADVAILQRETGENLVRNVLLVEEAKRRGIKPDPGKVKKVLDDYDQAQQNNPQWQKTRAELLPEIKAGVEERGLVAELMAQMIGSVHDATAEQAKAYYESHREKFVEPEQVRISVILLKVDPGAGQAARDQATEEARGIVKSLKEGASFADMARLRSGDESAPQGGDMGYLHKGMLPASVQETVDKLQPGMLSEPFNVLDGVAIIHFDAIKLADPKKFEEVTERAGALWKRDEIQRVWDDLLARLKKQAKIQVNESRYLPLAKKEEAGKKEESGGGSGPAAK
jgi:parvulin-like peptidyl-prolyl isomerase